jgi:hypothetical protein
MMRRSQCQCSFILKIAFRCTRLGKIGQSDPRIYLLHVSHRAWPDMGERENDGSRCPEGLNAYSGHSKACHPSIASWSLPVAAEMSTATDDDKPAPRILRISVHLLLMIHRSAVYFHRPGWF